ncbi:hypothetical protein JAAARDRAFT_28874 [Jaapia argillacea MUCL 33604]|uniref:TPX2 C-terminal domain-containing protein n=1 Tax=Jaapia argillacea MUCL 33604 TaxID=933084 RepID=A0A067Q780_9AGAM|nr:hypothetical protein JAAARDRAFT_28874 [Jaapia argillacea MUCL 33604]
MPPFSFAELSLHHLPELSVQHLPDQSEISFQIPAAANSGDLLLADDSDDFFRNAGADSTLSTPMIPKKAHQRPLVPLDLTPKSNPGVQTTKSPLTPISVPQSIEDAMATSLLETRSSFNTELSKRANPDSQPQSVAIAGMKGIAENNQPPEKKKTKKPIARAESAARPAPPRPNNRSNPNVGENTSEAQRGAIQKPPPAQPPHHVSSSVSETTDTSMADMSASSSLSGVAQRLVMFSQGLMGLSSAANSEYQAATVTGTGGPGPIPPSLPLESLHVDPLTLSQISPRKEVAPISSFSHPGDQQHHDATQAPISPMRTSSKRPASPSLNSAITTGLESRKKGKTVAVEESTTRTKPLGIPRTDRVTKPNRRRNIIPSSTRATNLAGSKSAVLRERPPITDVTSSVAESSTKPRVAHGSSREKNSSGSGRPVVPDQPTLRRGQISTSERPYNAFSSGALTKPTEFRFESDLHFEARKTEESETIKKSLKRSTGHHVHPIPDFKALHAIQEAALAARRDHIALTIPEPLEFSTDIRAKEREKFEEARRARERELERQLEERRKQKELEEAKEIRELRKRAIPKANEVPDWYADAPKKAGGSSKDIKG